MIEMTDERAAEVLAAHNAWRRYDRLPGEPGAPEMGDPVELGRAIDHVVSRLRSKPPAEAQPSAPVGVDAIRIADDLESWVNDTFVTLTPMRKMDVEDFVRRIRALAQQPAAVEGAAMKEETLEHQLEHCDGKDCTCVAYGECECACGADWTPAEVYLLRDQVDALRKDAERIRWLAANMRRVYGRREVGGYELPDIATVESCRESCDPQHLREAIDAAIAMATVAVATGEPQREDQPE